MDWFQVCAVCACLCAQAAATPPPGYVKAPDTDQHPPKYEFGYDVNDGYGGSQGHLETRDGEFALGKYYVSLPSNEQKVDYFADDWGFHPLVEYKTSSKTSSMSTQFALGEKAVAALSRQYGVAPPLEILKTNVAGEGPQVSIPAAAGFIPGPSDGLVPNSLDGEAYLSSTTTPSPSTLQVGVSSTTTRYEDSSSGTYQRVPVGTVPTSRPVTHIEQTSGVHSTTGNYPELVVGGEGLGSFESQKQISEGIQNVESYKQTGNEDFQNFESQKQTTGRLKNVQSYKQTTGIEGLKKFELQKQTPYHQSSGSGSVEYHVTGSLGSDGYSSSSPSINYQSTSLPVSSSGQISYNNEQQSPLINYQSTSLPVSSSGQISYNNEQQSPLINYQSTSLPVSSFGQISYNNEQQSPFINYQSTSSPVSSSGQISYNNEQESPLINYQSTSLPVSSSGQISYNNEHQSPLINYQSTSSPVSSSGQISYNNEHKSLAFSGNQGQQITSYLADSSSAVDITGIGSSARVPAAQSNPANTHISAIFVGEGGNQYEENEINEYNNRYISSTTQRPLKTVLKPIVVSETGGSGASLALYSGPTQQGLTYFEGQRKKVIGKLYHREGRVKSSEENSSSPTSGSVEDEDTPGNKEYYSTPAPTPEPVLVTPKVEASRLISSGNILAPIQAGVSISNNQHQEEDCDEKEVLGKSNANLPLSSPDIEKQVLHEEAVYKTTVDIQKSIPFEIHPDENDSQISLQHHKGESVEQQTNSQEGYSAENIGALEEYRQSNRNQVSLESYSPSYKGTHPQSIHHEDNINIGSYSQGGYESHENKEYNHNVLLGYRDQQYPSSSYQTPGPPVAPVKVEYDVGNQYNQNNFLQRVVYAYHRMANNQYKQQTDNIGYQADLALPTQPLFVPNRLYYVYLQRYNPYVNRYGGQSQLYTNYRPAVTSSPVINTSSALYGVGQNIDQENKEFAFSSSGRTHLAGSQGEENYNLNANAGYASYVNHEEIQQNGYSQKPNLGSLNVHNYHDNSPNRHQLDEATYSSQSSQDSHRGNLGVQDSVDQAKGGAGNVVVAANPVGYNEHVEYKSQNVARDYAAQLNSLESVGRGLTPESAVHPDNQHVQYSTGQGGNSQALAQESYSQDTNADVRQEQSISNNIHNEKYIDSTPNEVHQHSNNFINDVLVPQYFERTKLVEVEKPVHITHPVPIELTKIVEKPVPIPHPVPVPQTQYIEKPVAVPHPVPYAVTKLVTVERPVAYPQPVPVPYAVPHPVGVPVPQLVPYPQIVPVPVKDSRPYFIYRKPTGGRLLHRDNHQAKSSFRPSQPVFTSQYPPQTYHITEYLRTPHAESRGHGRKLCIEYGGFKPPLVPSVQVDDDTKPTYGPPAKQ